MEVLDFILWCFIADWKSVAVGYLVVALLRSRRVDWSSLLTRKQSMEKLALADGDG